jgi:hypothetical protein
LEKQLRALQVANERQNKPMAIVKSNRITPDLSKLYEPITGKVSVPNTSLPIEQLKGLKVTRFITETNGNGIWSMQVELNDG